MGALSTQKKVQFTPCLFTLLRALRELAVAEGRSTCVAREKRRTKLLLLLPAAPAADHVAAARQHRRQ